MDYFEADRGSIMLTWAHGRRDGPTLPPKLALIPEQTGKTWGGAKGRQEKEPMEGFLSFKTKGTGHRKEAQWRGEIPPRRPQSQLCYLGAV